MAKAQSTASLHRSKPLSITASEAGYRTAALAPSILLNTVQTPSSHQTSQKKLRPFAERPSEASKANRSLGRHSSFINPAKGPLVLRRKSGGQTQMQQPKQRRGSPSNQENNSFLPPRRFSSKKGSPVQDSSLDHPLEVDPHQVSVTEPRLCEPDQLLPSVILLELFKHDFGLFPKFLCLSPAWHTSALQAMDDYCNGFENDFVRKASEHVHFRHSYSQSRPIAFLKQRGLRLDRVLQCEVGAALRGHTLRLAYQYQVYGDKRWYRAEFKVDVACHRERTVWVHRDTVNGETYSQPIQQVCSGDVIELAMNVVSLQGFVRAVEWEKP